MMGFQLVRKPDKVGSQCGISPELRVHLPGIATATVFMGATALGGLVQNRRV